MNARRLFVECMAAGVLCGGFVRTNARAGESEQRLRVIPAPRVVHRGGVRATVSLRGMGRVLVRYKPAGLEKRPAVAGGVALLKKRMEVLGGDEDDAGRVLRVQLEKLSAARLAELMQSRGAEALTSGARLDQAYSLEIGDNGDIQLAASGDLGFFYGLMTLCQLAEKDDEDDLVLPVVSIADWPDMALRLGKTSATFGDSSRLRLYTRWLPLFRINMIGLQYHGGRSRFPEATFKKRVAMVCREERERGSLETIVYFCPFRGGGKWRGADRDSYRRPGALDMTKAEDRKIYVEFLEWVMDQGAHGIEVDYNDWPGPDATIVDVFLPLMRATQPAPRD